jgi:hypothetical protein
MERIKEILIHYAQADFYERMHLFLQFPDLRDTFQEIERKSFRCSDGLAVVDCTAEQKGNILRFSCSSVGSARHRDCRNRNGLLVLK